MNTSKRDNNFAKKVITPFTQVPVLMQQVGEQIEQTVAVEAQQQLAGPVAQVVAPEVETVKTFVPEQIVQTVEVEHDEQLATVQLVLVVATQAPDTKVY